MPIFSSERGGASIIVADQLMLVGTVLSVSATKGSIRVRYSSDFYTASPTWSSAVVVQSPASQTPPSLCGPDSKGRVYLWYVDASNNLAMKYSDDLGKTWTVAPA